MKLLLLTLFCASIALAQPEKSYVMAKMQGGRPPVDTLHLNYVLCVESGDGWGGYLVTGDKGELDKLLTRKDVFELARLNAVESTGKNPVKGDLREVVSAKKVSDLTELTKSLPKAKKDQTVTDKMTHGEAVSKMFKGYDDRFDLHLNDVKQR